MANIHFIGGEKGGVGKSMTARLLAQYCIDRHVSFLGFDGDASHRSFRRFYGEFAAPVALDDYTGLDVIVEAAETDPSREIIVDLAAQSARRLDRWIAEADIIGLLKEMGYSVFFWHLLDDGADTVKLLDDTLRKYGNNEVKIIVVQNMGRGENFTLFQQSDTYQRASSAGAHLFTLGRLHPSVTQKIDFADLSFWAAAHNKDALSLTERQRVKVWLRDAFQQFDTLFANAPMTHSQSQFHSI